MCGIAGMIDFSQDLRNYRETARKMQNAVIRRGPDQKGTDFSEHAVLIHTRLAVIDPENGKQPMKFTDGDEVYTIVYNGELYNTQEIRNQLLQKGCEFVTHSDTEVLLKAYMIYHEDCVKLCNGIFAFAVWEQKKQRLFLARDRIGVKPLFYYQTESGLIFGSELKAILAHPDVPHEIDLNGISQILLFGPGRTPGCGVFRNMKEILPAHCAYYTRENGLQISCYWKLEAREHTENFSQTAEHVRFLLTDAIRRQLVSDVPIGTFLSGGLDSSLISSVAARVLSEQGKTLHTFSVDYRDNEKYFQKSKFQPNSDPAYIRQMQEYLNAEHHWTVIDTPQLAGALFEAVEARDLPGMVDVDSSLLLFCKEIKQHVTAALSGECADELFGGYPWYRDPEIRAAYGFPWSQSTAYRLNFAKPELRELLEDQHDIDREYQATLHRTALLPDEAGTEKRMKEMMRLNLDWFMQTLLDRKDRMSMWNALEVRVPFCDYRIAQYLYNIPWEFKEYNGYEKGLLREAMKDYLPDEILWRKKSPYPKTHNPNYLAAVIKLLEDRISDPAAPILQIIRKEALERLMYGDENVQFYGQLMTKPQTIAYFLQLDYWLEKYQVKICL
ncbi:MAG: asparagine synthase (glutamine-hydrolyzing) [Oscillospiraceae bacterium]|nr:asparagine synthase (glutamine-hydrolyzing) [Oscillospiraceae bacterium]